MLICFPRTERMLASESLSRSLPFILIEPETISPASGNKRIIDNAVMDLPQPDSPNKAKVSPCAILSDS